MNVIRTALEMPGGIELVYTTNEGRYLGRLRMEARDPQAMKIMMSDALDFCTENEAQKDHIVMPSVFA